MLIIKRKEPPKTKEPIQHILLESAARMFGIGFKVARFGNLSAIHDNGASFTVTPQEAREFAKAVLEMADQVEGIPHEED